MEKQNPLREWKQKASFVVNFNLKGAEFPRKIFSNWSFEFHLFGADGVDYFFVLGAAHNKKPWLFEHASSHAIKMMI